MTEPPNQDAGNGDGRPRRRPRDLALYVLGTLFGLAGIAAIVALIAAAVMALPLAGLAFPLTLGLLAVVLAALWLRHRLVRRRERRDGGDGARGR